MESQLFRFKKVSLIGPQYSWDNKTVEFVIFNKNQAVTSLIACFLLFLFVRDKTGENEYCYGTRDLFEITNLKIENYSGYMKLFHSISSFVIE